MFCYQCQETARNIGCDFHGMCGKDPQLAALQDYLLYALKGLSILNLYARAHGVTTDAPTDLFVAEGLFATLTNVNFDPQRLCDLIRDTFRRRDALLTQLQASGVSLAHLPAAATVTPPAEDDVEAYASAGEAISPHGNPETDPDVLSLRELLTYGLKGLAAYCDHAYILDHSDPQLLAFLQEGLAATLNDTLGADQLVGLSLRCGTLGAQAMALLDEANTGRFGHPRADLGCYGCAPGSAGHPGQRARPAGPV